MPQETRMESPTSTAATAADVVVALGGGYDYYPTPQAVFSAIVELTGSIRRRAATLAILPPGAEGGFLQPPQGSHFGRES
jgi:hypothetical protein